MKTFKSAKSTLELTVVRTNEDLVRIITQLPDETGRAIDLAPSDAPAMMHALAEAAGVEKELHRRSEFELGTPEHLECIAYELDLYNRASSKRADEAKEKAELEAEALELYKAAYPVHADWDWESVANTDKWLAVARRAREMRPEK